MATTFKQYASEAANKIRNSHADCTTGTEASTVLDGASGLDLYGITGWVVHGEFGSAATVGKLLAYILNPVSGKWNPAPKYDVAVAAGSLGVAELCPINPIPTFQRGTRLAYLPDSLGAIAVAIDINGTPVLNTQLQ